MIPLTEREHLTAFSGVCMHGPSHVKLHLGRPRTRGGHMIYEQDQVVGLYISRLSQTLNLKLNNRPNICRWDLLDGTGYDIKRHRF